MLHIRAYLSSSTGVASELLRATPRGLLQPHKACEHGGDDDRDGQDGAQRVALVPDVYRERVHVVPFTELNELVGVVHGDGHDVLSRADLLEGPVVHQLRDRLGRDVEHLRSQELAVRIEPGRQVLRVDIAEVVYRRGYRYRVYDFDLELLLEVLGDSWRPALR